jgi:hypothetical protein
MVDGGFRRLAVRGLKAGFRGSARLLGPAGGLSRHYPTGFMVLWVSILLGAYLLFYFL